jgi:hypothetical protein
MTWDRPRFDRSEVNRAGRELLATPMGEAAPDWALEIVNNWRASHSYPLNAFEVSLRERVRKHALASTVVQRLKRLPSIRAKLALQSSMKLTQMQDIGGCRAVVPTWSTVLTLSELYKASRQKHALIHEDDYINGPKESGYRGFHLIYRYESRVRPEYNGLKIEIQLRTRLQHAWATAVETVGTLLTQPLKSSIGEEDWLRFFSLMGSALAFREGTPTIPGTPTSLHELEFELRDLSDRLRVENVLTAYGRAIQTIYQGERRASYYLLELQPAGGKGSQGVVTITGFESDQLEEATRSYLGAEKRLTAPGTQAVLVSGGSLQSLAIAYPNFFLDTRRFLDALREALGRAPLNGSGTLKET